MFVIDVRSLSEYESGHLPNAFYLPLESVPEALNLINPDSTVIVYCQSGNRSGQATNILVDLGYKLVLDGGGINDYKGEIVTVVE